MGTLEGRTLGQGCEIFRQEGYLPGKCFGTAGAKYVMVTLPWSRARPGMTWREICYDTIGFTSENELFQYARDLAEDDRVLCLGLYKLPPGGCLLGATWHGEPHRKRPGYARVPPGGTPYLG